MTEEGFLEWDVEVVTVRLSMMLARQLRQHFAVGRSEEDAVEHDVKIVIERIASDDLDKANVGRTGAVMLFEDFAANHVLADDRHAFIGKSLSDSTSDR
jgi:hypothetical protein